jgi:hypothetical protein
MVSPGGVLPGRQLTSKGKAFFFEKNEQTFASFTRFRGLAAFSEADPL